MALINPIIATESDLSVTRTELQETLAQIMGWDRTPGNWDTDQTSDGNRCLKNAERRAYGAHDWSFLTVNAPATLVVDQESYDLPDDFAAMEAPIRFTGQWAGLRPMQQASLGIVGQGGEGIVTSGVPRYYAVEALPHTGEFIGQRYGLHFDLKPAQAYTIKLQYRANPYASSSTRAYPLGGQAFASCLIGAVMAQAEIELKRIAGGPLAAQFQTLLSEAVAEDLRKGPTFLGQNNASYANNQARRLGASAILYNGEPVE